MKNTTRRAFARLDLLILIVGIISVILIVLLPMFSHRNKSHYSHRCENNLKQVAVAELIFAVENEGKASWHTSTNHRGSFEFRPSAEVWRHFQVLTNVLARPTVLHCPADKEREPAPDWETVRNHNVSYFVNVAATITNGEPGSSTILFGDRLIDPGQASKSTLMPLPTNRPVTWTTNIHGKAGWLAFADGHLEQFTSKNLNKLVTDGALHGTKRTAPPALLANP